MRNRATLIEICTLGDDNALGLEIVEFPGLVPIRIANEDTLLKMGPKSRMLVLLNMHIGRTTSDTKMRDIWLVSMPKLKGSRTIDSISRTSVPNMHKRSQGLILEHCKQA